MNLRRLLPPTVLAAVLLVGTAWYLAPAGKPATVAGEKPPGLPAPIDAEASARSGEPLRPLPDTPILDPDKVALGRKLFHDPRLSADNTVSCASCHRLDRGGADGLPVSVGIGGAKGDINAPSVLTAALNFRQFWDGRAATLEEQAAGPILNPKEMGATWPQVLARLSADPELSRTFGRLYGEGLSPATIVSAIADFERSLPRPARFDRWLRGDHNAIGGDEQAGYQLFKKHGCIGCHQGVNVGGNLFQRFGIMSHYFNSKESITGADLGRFNVTGLEEDRHIFKVPSLRNVALTAPYFHDGSVQRLEDAVVIMGRHQLGIDLPPRDVALIVTFLKSLTGGEQP